MPARGRHPWFLLALAALAVAVLWPRARDETAVEPAPEPLQDEDAGLVVSPARGLDDVLVLGLPFGFRSRGELATVDLATGEVRREVHDGDRWPATFTDDRPIPDFAEIEAAIEGGATGAIEGAAWSPDGRHLAVFARARAGRGTGVSIYTEGRSARRFHRLQSVGSLVGGQLIWSPDSDAVYLLVDDRSDGASANRVVGIPLEGSARTVVRIDEVGWRWLTVAS